MNNFYIIRGSSWFNDVEYCRSADRYSDTPDSRDDSMGFRVIIRGSEMNNTCVIRGGSWFIYSKDLRCSNRDGCHSGIRVFFTGFRIIMKEEKN